MTLVPSKIEITDDDLRERMGEEGSRYGIGAGPGEYFDRLKMVFVVHPEQRDTILKTAKG